MSLTQFVEKKREKREYVENLTKDRRKRQTRERRSKTVYIEGTEKERKSKREKS